MTNDKSTGFVLQISGLDPDIIRMLKVYEAQNGLNHAEVFARALQALLAQEATTA